MRNFKLWIWPGLAAVACLSALAIWFTAVPIEADLRDRTLSALRADNGWAKVLIKGRDLTLTGLAPDEASREDALSIIRDVYGVRVVSDASVLLPEEKPYRLSAEKTKDGLILSGFVPNEDARAEIISTLTGLLPGIALSDQMNLARGAPSGLVSFAAHGLSVFPRLTTGSMNITDRTMEISGQALNPEDHQAALDALSLVPPSAGTVSAVAIMPAAAMGDYSWSAVKSAQGVVVDGFVPNEDTRKAVMDQAGSISGAASAEDRMLFATGVPDGVDWTVATDTALSMLGRMSDGTVSLRNRILDVSGDASDPDAFRSLQDLVSGNLQGGLVLGTADIGMAGNASYELTARLAGSELVLGGVVPDEALRGRLIELVRLKFGSIEINDMLQVRHGSPPGFEAAALTALQALSRLGEGEARIDDGVVSIRGSALNAAGATEVARLMKDGLADGYAGEAEVSADPEGGPQLTSETCQSELDRLMKTNIVRFETGEATIQDHSYGFLDRIAEIALQCGDTRLEISGHTDSDGSEADNLALSERRARAVVDFLVAAGVAANRLVAVGHGEEQPLASNETQEGKAANRRIEFRVLN